ncbi:MAG: DnaJ domain-containing protein [Acidobacteria bacterium]|nr:DnaJ domain-containing protein [Acidobacteriota bacterium]
MSKDYYATLTVSRNATSDQIREKFRELARVRHPDRFQGEARERAEIEFQEITAAFNVLSNPERRRQHDLELARPESGGEGDSQRLSRFHLEAGVQFYKDGNFFQASESFERATQADPKNAQAWHHLAQALAQQGRYMARATAAIEKACELSSMNVAYLKLAGRLFAQAGKPDRAEQYYNEAVAWGGEDPVVTKALEELRKGSRKGWGGLFGKGG